MNRFEGLVGLLAARRPEPVMTVARSAADVFDQHVSFEVESGNDGDAGRFVAELREALQRAAETLDLAEVDTVLARWHALATMAVNPLSEVEHGRLARAGSGDLAGLRARGDEHGNWITF